MIDIHCHILPNTDDGPQSLGESLDMARFLVTDGVTCVTATPHCNPSIHLLRNDILPRVAELNAQLRAAQIPLQILPGSEIQVTDTAEYRREFEAGLYCHLGDGRAFTLLEVPWSRAQFPPNAPALITWLRAQGMTPILAHPERHEYFARDPALLQALVDAGAWLQITVDSLLGNHGPLPKVHGEALLKSYPDCVLASDAHNMKRCSGLAVGYAWVRGHLGEGRWEELRGRARKLMEKLLAVGT